MSWAPAAALVVLLTLAAVLATSGLAKLRDVRATRDAFDALRVPTWIPADAAARALPWTELALAGLLLVAPGASLVPVAALVLGLMVAYAWLIARALRFEEPVTCSCFGALGHHDIDRSTMARNVLLSLLAAIALWFALDGGSSPSAVAALEPGGWATLAAALAAVVVALLVVGRAPTAGAGATTEGEALDYERAPVPYGVLALPDGTNATLSELASTQARLLVVLNQGCGPCVRISEKLDDWAERLSPAVGVLAVYPNAEAAGGAQEHAPDLAVWEPDLNVRRVFVGGTPTAVLLGADGLLAGGPVLGEDAVAELVETVLDELHAPPPEQPVPQGTA